LLADVETFVNENGLTEHLEVFKRGALVAQTPGAYDTIEGISQEERDALYIEKTKRWNHTRTLYFTIFLNSIAAAIQGWDQTGKFHGHFEYCAKTNTAKVPMVPICHSHRLSVSQTLAISARQVQKLRRYVITTPGSLD
jgi:hypothetical protein